MAIAKEGFMHEYEIRILKSDGSTGVIMQEVHLSTHAAVNKARRLAGERPFEVWSDDRCVYSTADKPSSPGGPPDRPAA